jgi:hypothetical protein
LHGEVNAERKRQIVHAFHVVAAVVLPDAAVHELLLRQRPAELLQAATVLWVHNSYQDLWNQEQETTEVSSAVSTRRV